MYHEYQPTIFFSIDDSFVREVLGGCQRNAARMQKDIENGIPPQEGAAQPPQNPRKRQKKAIKKEYVPGVGTANYAFMIALFQVSSTAISSLYLLSWSSTHLHCIVPQLHDVNIAKQKI